MNYLRHFALREPPFGITPDTSFFYPCRSTQEALNTLLVAVGNGEGFLKIVGEVGTGKTLICRKFLSTLDSSWRSAYIPNPKLEPRTLLLAIGEEFGMPIDMHVDQYHLLKGITRALLNLARQRRRVVLCMDEAQAMPLETLEALRLLTNIETEKRKLLQVVLFGQPELDRKLESASIRQLRQRITFQHYLRAFDEDELEAYVGHRLAVAGYMGKPLLTTGALRLLHRASQGVPRLVNILMHKSLLLVYGEGGTEVARHHVRAAAQDTPTASSLTLWSWPRFRLTRAMD